MRRIGAAGAGGAVIMPTLTQQQEALDLQNKQLALQQTYANLQIAQNLAMSQYLYLDEVENKDEAAKKVRGLAKKLIIKFMEDLETTPS